jgi:hypothetical protein
VPSWARQEVEGLRLRCLNQDVKGRMVSALTTFQGVHAGEDKS